MQTNQAGGTSYEQTTLPFGTALNAESTVSNNNKRFTSYDRSSSTGLDYAINRTYDSKQGRFTQVDPIGMQAAALEGPQTLNLYNYCGNDPVNHTDPNGLFWNFFKKAFKWIGSLFLKLFKSKVAKRIAVRFIVSFAVSGGDFGVAFRGVLPDILNQFGLNPNPLLTPSWNPNSKHPISLGTSSLSKYIIKNLMGGLEDDIDIISWIGSSLFDAFAYLLRMYDTFMRASHCVLKSARYGVDTKDNTERSAWFTENQGEFGSIKWPWSATSRTEKWKGVIPSSAIAIIHSHPPSASPRPSTTGGNTGGGDHGTATARNMPVFAVTRDAIWAALPNNKNPIQIVKGNWWKKYAKDKCKK